MFSPAESHLIRTRLQEEPARLKHGAVVGSNRRRPGGRCAPTVTPSSLTECPKLLNLLPGRPAGRQRKTKHAFCFRSATAHAGITSWGTKPPPVSLSHCRHDSDSRNRLREPSGSLSA